VKVLIYGGRQINEKQDWYKLPAGGMDRDEAIEYASWLAKTGRVPGARICTDSEWERAARGADEREFPHGNDLGWHRSKY
jgi:formylglycine-generating enzyme required for sulfatase activity